MSLLQPLLAGAPILLILVLMAGLRWRASHAGLAGLAVTLLLAVNRFGLGRSVLGEIGPGAAVGGAMAEAAFTAATILWILLPALAIHHMQVATGGVETLRASMVRLTDDPRLLALLIGWFFALFLEGAAGFGTPVALTAPFLVGVGFRRADALACALIGQAIGISFGAIGAPIEPQTRATGLSAGELSTAVASYHALLGWVMLLFLWRAAQGATRKDGPPQPAPAPRRERSSGGASLGWVALAWLCFVVPYYPIARWVGPELPTAGAAFAGGSVFVAVLGLRRGARRSSPLPEASVLLRAAAPYLALIAVVLATRLQPTLRAALTSVRIQWSAHGAFDGVFQPLYHPGSVVLFAFLVGAFAQRVSRSQMGAAFTAAARQLAPVAVALVAMLGVARLMVHAGMIRALADSAAAGVGRAWPLVAPFAGVLGAFVTGSATASNILLTDLQVAVADRLSLPVLPLAAAQCFGAAVGNIICPHQILGGAAVVGLVGGEGDVLRRTLVPCLVYALLGGLLALVLVRP